MAEFGNTEIQRREPEPVRIKSVTIEGFRSLRSIQDLELPQLVVLIGANGAGKTTLIRFFEMLNWMLKAKGLQEFVFRQGGGDDQFFMGARKTPRIRAELRLETALGLYDYRFDLVHVSGGDSVILMNEACRYMPYDLQSQAKWTETGVVGKESALLDSEDGAAITIVNVLRQCATYQFHDTSPHSAIHNRWDVTDSFHLRPDGGNLAAVLLDLRRTDEKRYALIVRQIRRVLPAFKDFVLEEGRRSRQGTAALDRQAERQGVWLAPDIGRLAASVLPAHLAEPVAGPIAACNAVR